MDFYDTTGDGTTRPSGAVPAVASFVTAGTVTTLRDHPRPALAERLAEIDLSGTEWMNLGLCGNRDPELFYPAKGKLTAPGKRVCMACQVRAECLEYALDHSADQYDAGYRGIWGGMNEQERKRLLRTRRQAA